MYLNKDNTISKSRPTTEGYFHVGGSYNEKHSKEAYKYLVGLLFCSITDQKLNNINPIRRSYGQNPSGQKNSYEPAVKYQLSKCWQQAVLPLVSSFCCTLKYMFHTKIKLKAYYLSPAYHPQHQGSHGHGKSWNLKPSRKVMEKSWIFVFFQEVMENCYFKKKSHGILQKPSVPYMI